MNDKKKTRNFDIKNTFLFSTFIFLASVLLITHFFRSNEVFLFIQNTFSSIETIKIGDNIIQPEKNWLEILRIEDGEKTIHPKLLFSNSVNRLSSDSDRFLFNIVEDDKNYFMGFSESEDFFFYKLDVVEAMVNDPVPDSGGCRVIYKKKSLIGKYCKLDLYLQDFNMKVIEPYMKDPKGSEFVIIKLKDALLETFTDVKINSSYKGICWPEKRICVDDGNGYNKLGHLLNKFQ